MKGEFIITTLKDTRRLAKNLASELRGGEIIGLVGNLGAGKTTFVQFLARALGVQAMVNSPTFNIIKVYKIKNSKIKNFVHIDAYRLNSPQELEALGVDEYFNDSSAVTIIEWADRVRDILPKNARVIQFEIENDTRLITTL